MSDKPKYAPQLPPLPWTEATWLAVCRMLRPDLTEEQARVVWRKLQSDTGEPGRTVIEGYGEEVLRVPVRDIRRIGELPLDVTIVRILHRSGSPDERYPHEWMSTGSPLPGTVLYVHIQHRLCARSPVGCPLQVGELDDFLTRYKEITEQGL